MDPETLYFQVRIFSKFTIDKRIATFPPIIFQLSKKPCFHHKIGPITLPSKFVLITKTIDVTCKQAMTFVAWKQENVKQNTDGEPTIIL